MSSPRSVSDAPLCVVLDIRHPLAYLALRPSIGFGREARVDIDWLPIEGQTLRPPSIPGSDDDRSARHKRHRANMIAREIEAYSQAQGLTVCQPYRDGSPHAAHLGWLWVRARTPEILPVFLEEIFRRYWAAELDAADIAATTAVLQAVGAEEDGFAAWATDGGRRVAAEVAAALRDAGVHQAPAYLVEEEIFYGRQHLPMIRWLLEGRNGPGPI